MSLPRTCKYPNLETVSILPPDEGFDPPPWNINEHPEKTEGWIEFQKMMRSDNEHSLEV